MQDFEAGYIYVTSNGQKRIVLGFDEDNNTHYAMTGRNGTSWESRQSCSIETFRNNSYVEVIPAKKEVLDDAIISTNAQHLNLTKKPKRK